MKFILENGAPVNIQAHAQDAWIASRYRPVWRWIVHAQTPSNLAVLLDQKCNFNIHGRTDPLRGPAGLCASICPKTITPVPVSGQDFRFNPLRERYA